MTDEQTVKCPICGKPYVFYMYYAGDQSACPSCRKEARSGCDFITSTTTTDNKYNS